MKNFTLIQSKLHHLEFSTRQTEWKPKKRKYLSVQRVAINPLDRKIAMGNQAYWSWVRVHGGFGVEFSGKDHRGVPIAGMVNPILSSAARDRIARSHCHFFEIPEHLDFNQGAAIPVAAVTLFRLLVPVLNRRSPGRALVVGGNGSVGSMAMAMMSEAGWLIKAPVASQLVPSMIRDWDHWNGVDLSSYPPAMNHSERWQWILDRWAGEKFDLVLDSSGVFNRAILERILQLKGWYVPVFTPNDKILIAPFWSQSLPFKVSFGLATPSTQIMKQISQWISTTKYRPSIDRVFPPSELSQELERLGKGGIRGKLIMDWTKREE